LTQGGPRPMPGQRSAARYKALRVLETFEFCGSGADAIVVDRAE